MTLRQSNNQNMFAAVLAYLDDHAADWSGNAVVTTGVTNFRVAKTNIDTKAQLQQDSDKTGYTSKKNGDLENMLALAYRMALRVHNYAVGVGNVVMAQAVNFSKNTLNEGAEQEMIKRCTTIATTATAALATTPAPNIDYKITAADVGNLQATIALIMPDTAERDVIGGSHTNSTASIISLQSIAYRQLKSLDRLIEGMIDDDEDVFITGYEILRRINNRHGRGAAKS